MTPSNGGNGGIERRGDYRRCLTREETWDLIKAYDMEFIAPRQKPFNDFHIDWKARQEEIKIYDERQEQRAVAVERAASATARKLQLVIGLMGLILVILGWFLFRPQTKSSSSISLETPVTHAQSIAPQTSEVRHGR